MSRSILAPLAATALFTSMPGAHAAAVVVDTLITLSNVVNNGVYGLATTDTLTVTPSGEIVAPAVSSGTAIYLGGNVLNRGRLRAAWGSETQGLWLGGASNVNASGALIETYALNVGLDLTNRGNLRTGIFTLPDGRALTAFTFPYGGANIASPATLLNASGTGRWDSFSDVVVQGAFLNEGIFLSQRNSITAPPAPSSYTPVFTLWQTSNTHQAYVQNATSGLFRVGSGTRADNGGLIFNQGTFEIDFDARLDNRFAVTQPLPPGLSSGRFENTGSVHVGGLGYTPAAGFATFRNQGEVLNAGRFVVREGGWFEDHGNFTTSASGLFDLQAGGLAVLSGFTENAGLTVLRGAAGVQNGGVLFSTGLLSVESGGSIYLDHLASAVATASGGRTSVAGSLLLYGEFSVAGNGNTFNPLAPELDVLAGADISVGGAAGRLVVTQAASVRNAGRIDVLKDGKLLGDFGARIENQGEVHVQAGGTLRLEGNWDESFDNKASGALYVHGTVSGGAQSRLVNEGRMVVHTGGRVSVPDILQVDGSLTIEAGATLSTPGGRLFMSGGQLSGNGRINVDVFAQGTRPFDPQDPACRSGNPAGIACFTPGSSPGHMDIDGSLTLGQGAVLELEIERDAAGVLHWDSVSAGSMSFLQGSLIRVLIGDTAPGAGILNLQFLNCLTGACDFGGASFEVRGGQGGSFVIGDGGLAFAMAADVTPVPEPRSIALILAGLGVVGFVARRRGAR
jgi:hypothetical protein